MGIDRRHSMTEGGETKRLLSAVGPERAIIAAGVAVSLIDVGANLLFPILTRNLIDGFQTQPVGALDPRVWLLIGVILVGGLAAALSGYLLSFSGQRIAARLRTRLFTDLIHKPVAFFDKRESGELVSRIINDVNAVSQVCTRSLSGFISGILLLLGSAVVLAFLDWPLTLTIFSIIIGAFVVMMPSFLKIVSITKEMNQSRAELNGGISRVFGQIRLVKAMNAKAVEIGRITSLVNKALSSGQRMSQIEALVTPINGLALSGAMVAIFTYGATRVSNGTMSIGTLTVFILYIFNVVAPIIQISTFVSQLQAARGSSAELCALLDEPPEDSGPGHLSVTRTAPATKAKARAIVFRDVEFAYPTRPGIVLSIPELQFPAGTCTALVGASGAGKTTIIDLIERFYALENGNITYGSDDITSFDLDEWRGKIGYVAQDAPLMRGTISDNIAYGSEGSVDRSRLAVAAQAGNCIDFIESLDAGFETYVGESGILLSAGQKQRIALARMFYRDPEILLFDEATANLDEANEAAVLRSLAAVIKGRTSIIITHRSATLPYADQVAVIERGSVAAILTPDQALARSELLRDRLDAA